MVWPVLSLAPISVNKMWPVHAIERTSTFSSSKLITLSIEYATKIVRNYVSNDIDLV